VIAEFIGILAVICLLAVASLAYILRPTNRANIWRNIPGRESLPRSGGGGPFTPVQPDTPPEPDDEPGSFQPRVNRDATCKLTGKRVGDCDCEQCREAKGEGVPR
jgi:hypothetical protein